MVVSADPLSSERAEMNILEINQELRSQLAESNQQFRDLKEKFLITQATAYSLANQLKKYKCEEYRNHLPPERCRRLKKRKSLRTHWRNVLSLVQIVTTLLTPTSLTGAPKSHLRNTKSTLLWL
nr:unnamed protein product [Homo sapiens]